MGGGHPSVLRHTHTTHTTHTTAIVPHKALLCDPHTSSRVFQHILTYSVTTSQIYVSYIHWLGLHSPGKQ